MPPHERLQIGTVGDIAPESPREPVRPGPAGLVRRRAYAAEELIVELGAAFVCADLALSPKRCPFCTANPPKHRRMNTAAAQQLYASS